MPPTEVYEFGPFRLEAFTLQPDLVRNNLLLPIARTALALS